MEWNAFWFRVLLRNGFTFSSPENLKKAGKPETQKIYKTRPALSSEIQNIFGKNFSVLRSWNQPIFFLSVFPFRKELQNPGNGILKLEILIFIDFPKSKNLLKNKPLGPWFLSFAQ